MYDYKYLPVIIDFAWIVTVYTRTILTMFSISHNQLYAEGNKYHLEESKPTELVTNITD